MLLFAVKHEYALRKGYSTIIKYFTAPRLIVKNKKIVTNDGIELKQAKLLNFIVNYVGEERHVQHLVSEIFGRKEYFFESETDSPLIVDCGSNIGISILFFKWLYPKSKIIGFEPDIRAFRALEKNIIDNGLTNVIVYNKALGTKTGMVSFFCSRNSCTNSMLSEFKEKFEETLVESVTLSSFIDQPIDCLKLDVEGAETGIIKDLSEANKLYLIKKIVMEFHHNYSVTENNLASFLEILDNNNLSYTIENGDHVDEKLRHAQNPLDKKQQLHICASKKIVC